MLREENTQIKYGVRHVHHHKHFYLNNLKLVSQYPSQSFLCKLLAHALFLRSPLIYYDAKLLQNLGSKVHFNFTC